jgi:pyridoxamine 5'-phosphate oxidase
MDFEDCIKFANENPIAYLATVEGNQPRVRAFQAWFADKTGFYYQTGSVKEIVSQLKANPKLEVCYFSPKPGGSGTMMRISGEVEFLNDRDLKAKAIADRPFLNSFGFTPDHPGLIIFRIAKGQAVFWTMATNLAPKKPILFG